MQNENKSLMLLNEQLPTLTQLILVNMPVGTTEQEAKRKGLREIMNMEAIMSMKPELNDCDPMSVVLAVKQCIADNLTLAPAAGLVYLYPQKIQVGTDGANQKVYKKTLVYDPTAEGRISIARQAGSILDHERPKCEFDHEGKVDSVSFTFLVPSYGCARWQTVRFGAPDFEKWKLKSASKFGGNANANYTSWKGSIDPEFAGSKAIRHALKKLGTNKNEERKFHYLATHEMNFEKRPYEWSIQMEGKQFLDIGKVAEPLKPFEQAHPEKQIETIVHEAKIDQPNNNNLSVNADNL